MQFEAWEFPFFKAKKGMSSLGGAINSGIAHYHWSLNDFLYFALQFWGLGQKVSKDDEEINNVM